jgi:hypothetical protein
MRKTCGMRLPWLCQPPHLAFVAVLLLLLQGPLAEGGLIFVLKSGSTGQNTKWLKVCGQG